MEPKLTNVETTMFEENIRKYPNWNEDDIIITEISQIEFAAKEVKHHEWCRAKYQTEAESIFQSKHSKTPTDASSTHSQIHYEWHKGREVHSEAFDALWNLIEV